jgi:hypothetical protein
MKWSKYRTLEDQLGTDDAELMCMEMKNSTIDYEFRDSSGGQPASGNGFNCNICGEVLSAEELDFGFAETCLNCTEQLDRAADRSKESKNRPR